MMLLFGFIAGLLPVHVTTKHMSKQIIEEHYCNGDTIPIEMAKELAIEHYHKDGIWADVFVIDQVICQRIEQKDGITVLQSS